MRTDLKRAVVSWRFLLLLALGLLLLYQPVFYLKKEADGYSDMAICCVYCIHDTYYLIVVLSAALVIAPVGYISNTWSSMLRMLSDESDLYMLGNGVACSHTVLELYSPLGDTFLQYALMSAYSAAIAFLFYSLSCGGKRIWAFTAPALLHAMMLIVYLDGFCAEYSLFTWLNLQAWGVADSVSKWRFAGSVFCLNISFLLIGMNRHGTFWSHG